MKIKLLLLLVLGFSSCRDITNINKKNAYLNDLDHVLTGTPVGKWDVFHVIKNETDVSTYLPIIDKLVEALIANYQKFGKNADDLNKFVTIYHDVYRPLFADLLTGFYRDGKGGELNQANLEKAKSYLFNMLRGLRDRRFNFLSLFGSNLYLGKSPKGKLSKALFDEKNPAFKLAGLSEVKDKIDDFSNLTPTHADKFLKGILSDNSIVYLHLLSTPLGKGAIERTALFMDKSGFLEDAIRYKKIIIDLRSSGGGGENTSRRFLSFFFPKDYKVPYNVGSIRTQEGERPWTNRFYTDFLNEEGDQKVPQEARIVVLVDGGTRNIAEHMVMALRRRNVIVVGSNTSGSISDRPITHAILYRNYDQKKPVLYWDMARGAIKSMRGEREGEGLRPDIEVNFLDPAYPAYEESIQRDGSGLITEAFMDPQIEEARKLLGRTSDAYFRELSDKFYTGYTEPRK